MIYGDDQCERCGGVRVAKSTLCANCLVKLFNKAVWEAVAQKKEIKKLKKRITRDRGRLEDALAYGFKQNQENVKLKVRCERMGNIALRRGKYGKDRETEDTGL